MHSQEDTLKILNCDKSTLSRYVKKEKLTRVKQGRKTFYDEYEVAILVKEIEDNKKKVGIEIKEKQSIPIKEPREVHPSKIEHDDNLLNKYGMQVLRETTDELIELEIYEKVYQTDLMDYAFNKQMYLYYSKKANELDSIQVAENGNYNVHPYHRVMMDYDKKIKHFQDRYYLNPLARAKLIIPEKVEVDEMEALISG